jgi:hypothetical protein
MWSNRFQKNIWLTHHAKYAVTLRQLKQTASKDMPDYKQTLRLSGCVPAGLSLESDAQFSASGAKHSFHAALPSPISCCQAYAANPTITEHEQNCSELRHSNSCSNK